MSITTGVLLFDGAEELDFVGPWEVFTMGRTEGDSVVAIAERSIRSAAAGVLPCSGEAVCAVMWCSPWSESPSSPGQTCCGQDLRVGGAGVDAQQDRSSRHRRHRRARTGEGARPTSSGTAAQHGNVAEVMTRSDAEAGIVSQLKGSAFFYVDVSRKHNEGQPKG